MNERACNAKGRIADSTSQESDEGWTHEGPINGVTRCKSIKTQHN